MKTTNPIHERSRGFKRALNFSTNDDSNNNAPYTRHCSSDYEYLTPDNMKDTVKGIFDVLKPLREMIKKDQLEAFERSCAADVESPDCSGTYIICNDNT